MSRIAARVQTVVDIRSLKTLAVEGLPSDSTLRKVLVAEPDVVAASDYVGKLGTWLAVLKEEFGTGTCSPQEGKA